MFSIIMARSWTLTLGLTELLLEGGLFMMINEMISEGKCTI